MAIISFAMTQNEFRSGIKTVTRRIWAPKHLRFWQKWFDAGWLIHDGWTRAPHRGGQRIASLGMTCRPYLEYLGCMPLEDLDREGGMCRTREEFQRLVKKKPWSPVAVVRFVGLFDATLRKGFAEYTHAVQQALDRGLPELAVRTLTPARSTAEALAQSIRALAAWDRE